jgi:23S rRNA (cytidine1920-2'-O)/16S rRNA (cytidine1409-2'-O)-methyltransferase
MVRRGLVSSRAEAGVAVDAKRVLVNGAIAEKTSRLVDPADAVVVTGDAPRFVSRGGEKLDRALDQFLIDVAGVEALDVGASTINEEMKMAATRALAALAKEVG